MQRAFRFLTLLVLVVLALTLGAGAQTGIDLDGRAVNPLTADPGKVTVLIFIRRDCPVSGRYAPLIQTMSKQYSDRASFWLVDPDKSDSPESIRSYLRDYRYHLPALRDPSHTLAQFSRVQITPEVAVFDRKHQLIYDGRIDDWYVDLTRARTAPTTHELDDAIQAALAGKDVSKREVRGVGCYIADLE